MDDINSGMNRAIVTNPWRRGGAKEGPLEFFINGNYGNSSSGDYDGTSKGFGVTAMVDVDSNWKIGASIDSIVTEIDEANSNSELKKIRIGLTSIYETNDAIFTTDLNYSKNNYKVNRSIYIWDNSSESTGYDAWIHQRAYMKLHENVIPFVGVNVGKSDRNEIALERGFFLSARRIEDNSKTYAYGEGGLRFMEKFGSINAYAQGGYTTDNWIFADAGAYYDIDKMSSIGLTVSRVQDNDSDAGINKIMLQGNIKF